MDPESGKFTWRPTEEQGPDHYEMTVRVENPDQTVGGRRKWNYPGGSVSVLNSVVDEAS